MASIETKTFTDRTGRNYAIRTALPRPLLDWARANPEIEKLHQALPNCDMFANPQP